MASVFSSLNGLSRFVSCRASAAADSIPARWSTTQKAAAMESRPTAASLKTVKVHFVFLLLTHGSAPWDELALRTRASMFAPFHAAATAAAPVRPTARHQHVNLVDDGYVLRRVTMCLHLLSATGHTYRVAASAVPGESGRSLCASQSQRAVAGGEGEFHTCACVEFTGHPPTRSTPVREVVGNPPRRMAFRQGWNGIPTSRDALPYLHQHN